MKVTNLLLTPTTNLTLADRRLYNYLLHHAIDKLSLTLNFAIKIDELEGVYAATGAPLPRIQESLRRLNRTLVEFELIEDGHKKWQLVPLIADVSLENNILSYSYPSTIRQLFVDPILLEKCLIQAHFIHKYSNLIYEILASEYYDDRTDYTIEIEDLRDRINVSADKMRNYTDFNRFVLDPALREINSYASFAVKFTVTREKRKVTHLHFSMTNKVPTNKLKTNKHVIPPRRPKLFIDNPEQELAYAYILNAHTDDRRRYFSLAQQKALQANKNSILERDFDRPDHWYEWVAKDIIKNEF